MNESLGLSHPGVSLAPHGHRAPGGTRCGGRWSVSPTPRTSCSLRAYRIRRPYVCLFSPQKISDVSLLAQIELNAYIASVLRRLSCAPPRHGKQPHAASRASHFRPLHTDSDPMYTTTDPLRKHTTYLSLHRSSPQRQSIARRLTRTFDGGVRSA